jgi:hypothetical protein
MRFDILGKVEFQPEDYGPDIARVLALASGGHRTMPLVKAGNASPGVAEAVRALEPQLPGSVMSGLYLYCGCWDEAHSAADKIEDLNGYFWHAIVHRQEPDPANSGYWFRKTGKHPIFPKLAEETDKIGYHTAREWDPFAFIEFCETARQRPDAAGRQMNAQAMQVQLVEWQLLFDYCARGQSC